MVNSRFVGIENEFDNVDGKMIKKVERRLRSLDKKSVNDLTNKFLRGVTRVLSLVTGIVRDDL